MQNKRLLLGFISILLLISTYIFVPPIFHGDANSAVYLLNTIAASLSTIFALSLSLIMVAIQLSAGKYSPRIFDFFLRFSYNVPLTIIFLGAIFHSTYTLGQIRKDNIASAAICKAISFDMVLLIYGFIILLVYIFNVIEILKPEKLVERLKKEVDDNLKRNRPKEAAYHMERLSDVAKKTTSEMDTLTAAACIHAIADTAHAPYFKDSEMRQWYLEHIVANLNGIASVTFNENEHAVAEVIIEELKNIANASIKEGNFHLPEQIIETFSIIVSGSLMGRKQLLTIQKIMERMEVIAVLGISVIDKQPQAAGLIVKVFKTMNYLGKQIMDAEVLGINFVAKYMVTNGLGTLMAGIVEKRCQNIISDIFYEYLDLVVRIMRKGETKNIIAIVTWAKQNLLDQCDNNKKIFFLKTYLMMAGVAIYIKRYDKASLIIKALGKYYPPDEELLQSMLAEQGIIKNFFDFNYPDKYLQEAFHIWGIYHQANKNMGKEQEMTISMKDVYKNMQNWESLFDGLPVEDIVLSDDLPEGFPDELINEADLESKGSKQQKGK